MFEDDDADILEDPLVRGLAAACASGLRLAAARYAPGAAVLTIALRLGTQGMGWLNQGSLTLSKQRPVGRLRKQKGIFIGASACNAAPGLRFLDAPV